MRAYCCLLSLAIAVGPLSVCGCGPSAIEAPPTEGLGPPDVSKLGGPQAGYNPDAKIKSKGKGAKKR